ncbi:MAG TPA: HEAT repeat domain-containing protein [Gemmataceae bacterium]|jgi:hypothetical protein|nr:HEAT repeat domain-containing protein [Gemmataceae bacterium]
MRVMLLLFVSIAVATAAPKPGDEGTPEFDKATALIKQLGDARFAAREAAAKQLVEMGGAAVPALLVGTKSSDEEIRTRSTALVPQARAAEWKKRADLYVADKEGKEKHDLPKLEAWEKLTGTPDAGTRKLYAEMVRSSGEFLMEASGPKMKTVLGARCTAIRNRVRTDKGQIKADPGELAAVVFVDTLIAPSKGPGPRVQSFQPALLGNPVWPDALDAADTGPVLRKLLVQWFETTGVRDDLSAQQFAGLVRKKPFPEAAPALANLAKDKRFDVLTIRAVAIETLGRIGGMDARDALTGLIEDKTSLYGIGDGAVQLGDAALAALIVMSGKKLSDYGLSVGTSVAYLTANSDEGITVTLHGFQSSDDRKKGFQKWKDENAKK